MLEMTEFESKMTDYYKLDDGRVWSVKDVAFVDEVPDTAIVGPCPDEQGNSTIEGLVDCLKFYGYPLGELASYASDYLFENLRKERDARLAATDYLLIADYPISSEKLEAIKVYRQALRDLPSQEGAPWTEETIPWPVEPKGE